MDGNSLWHPLSMVEDGARRTNIVSGDGAHVYDDDGRRYIDGLSGLWNVSLGYRNAGILQAITEQAAELPYVNLCEFKNSTVNRLADKLTGILHPDISKIYFTCTGSESNELAIKLIRKYQAGKKVSRNKIGVLQGSYHGSYFGSLSASQFESEHKRGYGPFLSGFLPMELPFCRCCPSGNPGADCLEEMVSRAVREIEQNKEELAGILLEPVVGSGGIIPLPWDYVQTIAGLCRKYDILLACDEVATGFGRTGTMFAYEQYQIEPDIICMSKGINSGYLPLGAVAVSRKIEQLFRETGEPLFHLSTQNGNPVSCAAALAAIHQLEKDDNALVRHVNTSGKHFRSMLEQAVGTHPNVSGIRGRGLMIGIDLVESKHSNQPLNGKTLERITARLRKNGLISEFCYHGGLTSCIVLFPPFVMTEAQYQQSSQVLAQTLERFG